MCHCANGTWEAYIIQDLGTDAASCNACMHHRRRACCAVVITSNLENTWSMLLVEMVLEHANI